MACLAWYWREMLTCIIRKVLGAGVTFFYHMLRNLFIFFAFIHFARASDLFYDPTDSLFDDYSDPFFCEDGAELFEITNMLPDPLEIWQQDQDFESMTSKSLSDEISSEGSLPQALKPASNRATFYLIHSQGHKSILAKLKQIFSSQCPNEKFDLRHYDVINWPEDVNLFKKKKWTERDIEKIEAHLGVISFKRRDQKITKYVQYNAADLEEHTEAIDMSISFDEAYSIVKKRFQKETGYKTKIQWHLLDKSALPSKYADISFNHDSFLLVGLHRNREILDNIHFKGAPLSGEIKDGSDVFVDVEEKPISRTKIKAKLREAFKVQHPHKSFVLGDEKFEVQNWPEDVNILETKWTASEMVRIDERIPQLVFIKRVMPAAELDIEKLGDMSDILRSGWSQEHIDELLQERDRLETDYPVAKSIVWTELDNVRIPRKYEPLQINYAALNMAIFFRNPAIIDDSQECSKKRQSDQTDETVKKSRRPRKLVRSSK